MLNVKTLALILMLLVAALAVACGDDDDDGEDGNGGSATDPPAATATEDGGDGETKDTEFTVVMENTAFDPTELTIPAATDVVIALENLDSTDHTFTLYLDEEYTEQQGTTLPLSGGASDEVRGSFDAATYYYRCEIHTSMQGTLTAE